MEAGGQLPSQCIRHELLADVLVVPVLRLRCGREERLRKALGELHAARKGNAAHTAQPPVLLPARPVEKTPHHALERHRVQPLHEHGTAVEHSLRRRQDLGVLVHVVGNEVIGNDVFRAPQPPGAQTVEHPTLFGNPLGEYHVERRDPVGGDEEKLILDGVDVADLAARAEGNALERGGQDCFRHSVILRRKGRAERERRRVPRSFPSRSRAACEECCEVD